MHIDTVNFLFFLKLYCMEIPSVLYGVSRRILVHYDPWNHVNLCNKLSESIARAGAELWSLNMRMYFFYKHFQQHLYSVP